MFGFDQTSKSVDNFNEPKLLTPKWSNRLGSADFLALDGLPLLHKVGLVGEVDVAAKLVTQRGVLKAEK